MLQHGLVPGWNAKNPKVPNRDGIFFIPVEPGPRATQDAKFTVEMRHDSADSCIIARPLNLMLAGVPIAEHSHTSVIFAFEALPLA